MSAPLFVLPPPRWGRVGVGVIRAECVYSVENRSSVMGLAVSTLRVSYLAAGFMLPFVVDGRPPHHAIRTEPASQSNRAWSALERPPSGLRLHRVRVPATGPRGRRLAAPPVGKPSSLYAAAPAWLQRNSLPSRHRRCSTVASLRASATLARLRPRRLATASAQRFRLENRVVRLNMTCAAS